MLRSAGLRRKRCRSCGERFVPQNSLQTACSTPCAIALAPKLVQRQLRKEAQAQSQQKRAGLERLMTRSDWLKRAQKVFNEWVRLRDAARPCISCGATQCAQWQAGHYRTVKAAPELRFEPLNVHRQCSQCNGWDSGNIVEYRRNLIHRIGVDQVAWLEGPHEPKKYSIPEIKALIARYRGMIKMRQAGRAA